MRVCVMAALAAALFIIGGCAIDLSGLVPGTTVGVLQTPDGNSIIIRTCTSRQLAKYTTVADHIGNLQNALPQSVGGDPVVKAVITLSSYVSAQSLRAAAALTTDVSPDQMGPDAARPSINITAEDVHTFGKTVSNKILTHTSSTPPTANDPTAEQQFWEMLFDYYYTYYKGNFIPYMGNTLPAPALSSSSTTYTINDTEIVYAATVFVDFLLDEIFKSPVWKGADKKYYPQGSKNEPTSVALGNLTSQAFDTTNGCGMTATKANFVRYMSNAFADAATSNSSLAIKTAGGVDIGFGVLGKVNVGDNKTLTDLIQMAVGEVVSRVTVAFAVPILSVIDFSTQGQLKAAVTAPSSGAQKKNGAPSDMKAMSALFISMKSQ